MHPTNPVAAATHANPYPYYRRLLEGPALHFEPGLKLWVASRASVISEVLGNAQCLVRPAGDKVPAALANNPASEVFGRLVRMNEGAAHANPRLVIGQALAAIEPARVAAVTRHFAGTLGARYGLHDSAGLNGWIVDLPTYVVADLLGVGQDGLAPVARWMADFVRCLSPLSTAAQLAEAGVAAQALIAKFEELVQASAPDKAMLLGDVCRRAGAAGWDDQHAILANMVGLLSQTHEATAGLIGNSIVALLGNPHLQAQVRADPALVPAFVHEVARYDPPVQNTRRFVCAPTTVAGMPLEAGDIILLLLAAAGRDGEVHHQPDVFMPGRPQRQLPAFGHGRHACPGREIAHAIAAGAIQHLVSQPAPLDRASFAWSYRPSANGRLPVFSTTAGSDDDRGDF